MILLFPGHWFPSAEPGNNLGKRLINQLIFWYNKISDIQVITMKSPVRREKQLLSETQKEEIIELISYKQEGAFWDFKKEWYEEGNQANLLHDIICMANNLENRDAYIIIGIDEENEYCVNDMAEAVNRKSTQMLVDFLRDKKFIGGIRPSVMVESMQLDKGIIDIIIIKNGYYTPYVLEEKYRDVNANNIYTRVMDSNTPKNKTAEISHIEYLWKKRFHLLTTPLEQVFYYLKNKKDWLDAPDDSAMTRQYYKYSPEYIIEHCRCDERDGYEYYLFSQMDSRPHWYNIYVKYHQTTLFSTIGVGLDGGRYFTNVPCTDFLIVGLRYEQNVSFKYYVKGSKEMILHDFLFDKNEEAIYARNRFEGCILIFSSDTEKDNFKKYAISKWTERQTYLIDVSLPFMKLPECYRKDAFKEDYENAIVLKKMLDEYRTNI